jgi:hypothetical protein
MFLLFKSVSHRRLILKVCVRIESAHGWSLMSDELPVGAVRRQWLTLFICIGTVGILCLGFYFLLVSRAGLLAKSAIYLAGATFVVSVVPAVCGALRIERTILWIGAGFVVVMLATMINLGMSFILVPALATFHALGLPISEMLVDVVAWIGAVISLACAAGVWWILWKRFKAPLEGKEAGR